MADALSYKDMISNLRFAVITISGIKGKRTSHVPVIVLLDKKTRAIVKVTDYADYLTHKRLRDGAMFPRNGAYTSAVAHFLNWILIDNYDRYRITDIREVTVDMVSDYIRQYAETELKTGGFPTIASVQSHRNAVCLFLGTMAQYKKMKHVRTDDLYTINQASYSDGRITTIPVWRIPAKTMNAGTGYQKLMRDMPLAIAKRFIDCAEAYDPELVLPIVLSIFGGLRESEVTNLCRNDGILGECFRITRISGVCTGMEINLLQNRNLRSDGISVGSIKRKRRQALYEPFIPYIESKINAHIEMIKNRPCEPTMPLFLSKEKKNGLYMAMTVDAYRKRVQALYWNHVLPSCKNDVDTDLALYYNIMIGQNKRKHSWGAHAFRHLFTVMLVLTLPPGSVYTVQALRGDRSPKSAEDYLSNKGELERLYTKAVDRLIQMIGIYGKEVSA